MINNILCWNVRAHARLRIWTRKNLANKMELYQQTKNCAFNIRFVLYFVVRIKLLSTILIRFASRNLMRKNWRFAAREHTKKKMGRWPQWMTSLESIWKLMMFLWIFVRFISIWMQFSKYRTWFLHQASTIEYAILCIPT